MRRMMWLTAGAVLGVAGYRRLDRAAKALTGQFGSGAVTRQAVQVSRAQVPGAESGRQLSGARTAGVESGRGLLSSRQLASGLRTSAGLTLSLAAGIARQASAFRARRAARARASLTGERRAGIGAFLGDVRDGMDEYLDVHASEVPADRVAGSCQVRAHSRREIGSSKI
jgi:hypothetical protein